MLKVNNIELSVSGSKILNNISFEIQKNKTVALLGPNGAGKSTLIDIITENLFPQSGYVEVNGKKFGESKKDIGILYEVSPLFETLKVKEVVNYISLFHSAKKAYISELINVLDIKQHENKLIRVLSKGEKRKVAVLLTIMHSPKLIILDEPTSGLDPFLRDICWKLFKDENRTIFFSTHIWEEASKYADGIIFFKNGTIYGFDKTSLFLSDKYIKAKEKIVVNADNGILNIIGDQYYFKDGDQYTFFPDPENFELTARKIKSYCNTYSVLPIDLKDIYNKLTN